MADGEKHVYQMNVKLTDGTTQNAGTITVTDGINGTNGTDGTNGKDGTDGKDGVGVEEITLEEVTD